MANFPASLDSLSNPTATTKRNDPGFELHTVISTLNDIAEAVETKLGITDTPAVDTPAGNTVLASAASGKSSWRKIVPADITDRIRQKWIGAPQFILASGTPAMTVLSAGIAWPYWALDPTTQESIASSFDVPLDFVSGSFTVNVYYFCPNTGTGNVKLGVSGRPIGNGNALDTDAAPVSPGTTCAAPGVASQMAVVQITAAFGSGQITAGEASQIQLIRYAADAGDTYASDVYVAGLMLSYTADS